MLGAKAIKPACVQTIVLASNSSLFCVAFYITFMSYLEVPYHESITNKYNDEQNNFGGRWRCRHREHWRRWTSCFFGWPVPLKLRDHALEMAGRIGAICKALDIPWIYKSCYDKDCRSSIGSFHGIGIDDGLEILAEVRVTQGVPVVCDFSDAEWAAQTASVVDFIQIPAYLCRQTHVLLAAEKPANRFT